MRAADDNDASSSDIHSHFLKVREKQWASNAGMLLQKMLEGHEYTMSLLRHPSPGVRNTAIQVLMSHWNARDNKFAKVCEDLCESDPDCDVRLSALIALGLCWCNSDNRRISAMLARIVKNESAPADFRRSAFMSLLHVRKGTPAALEAGAVALSESWVDDIDWGFVEESLDASRLPKPVHPCEPYVKYPKDIQ